MKMKIVSGMPLVVLVLAGCATNKPLEGLRVESITPLEVVQMPTPEIQRHSPGTMLGGGLLFGGFGMEAVAAGEGQKLREQCGLEHFGELVVREFTNAAPQAIPSFAGMRIVGGPVQADRRAPGFYALAVKPSNVWLYTFGGAQGLNIVVIGSITSPAGNVIWERTSFYSSKVAGRVRPIEELEADSCKLLKEEMRDAASAIAGEWIADLKGAKP